MAALVSAVVLVTTCTVACCPSPLPLATANECFQRRDGCAPNANVDFDHGPQVNGDTVIERVFRFRVDTDGVETDDGGDAAEDTEREDENERKFLAVRPLNAHQGLNRESYDPDIRNNIER